MTPSSSTCVGSARRSPVFCRRCCRNFGTRHHSFRIDEREALLTNATPSRALVTGANRGIGFEIARQLAISGVSVLLSGRNPQAIVTAAATLQAAGLDVAPCLLDVTDTASIQEAAAEVAREYGTLDILVNNAAIRVEKYGKQPSEQPLDQWRETFETNLFGVVEVTQAFLPLILKSKAGRIVNVSSLLGSVQTHTDPNSYAFSPTFKSLPAYSASKSAINSWTVHLAFELRETNIKVNAVHPGYTKTDLNDGDGDFDVSTGARTSVEMALLANDGPTGSFTHMGKMLPW
ncbi:SDR family oxidoreductase [Cryobacterium sp. MDB2-A-2]|nr:SDR family oxidoreductase [Cryobacterium sp. MDB2-A-1]TFC16087.1 SDR family oxidoreductase [Cryobacterium sp. MDB2-A-2]